jgi:hypothetical protein
MLPIPVSILHKLQVFLHPFLMFILSHWLEKFEHPAIISSQTSSSPSTTFELLLFAALFFERFVF